MVVCIVNNGGVLVLVAHVHVHHRAVMRGGRVWVEV